MRSKLNRIFFKLTISMRHLSFQLDKIYSIICDACVSKYMIIIFTFMYEPTERLDKLNDHLTKAIQISFSPHYLNSQTLLSPLHYIIHVINMVLSLVNRSNILCVCCFLYLLLLKFHTFRYFCIAFIVKYIN